MGHVEEGPWESGGWVGDWRGVPLLAQAAALAASTSAANERDAARALKSGSTKLGALRSWSWCRGMMGHSITELVAGGATDEKGAVALDKIDLEVKAVVGAIGAKRRANLWAMDAGKEEVETVTEAERVEKPGSRLAQFVQILKSFGWKTKRWTSWRAAGRAMIEVRVGKAARLKMNWSPASQEAANGWPREAARERPSAMIVS